MFTLLRASNHFRTRLHFGLRAVAAAAPPQSYHTKSDILHQISPRQSNNFHHTQTCHRNLFAFRGFGSQSDTKSNKEEEHQQEDEGDGEDLKDGLSELNDPPTTSDKDPDEVTSATFNLFNVIASAPTKNVYAELNKFVEEIKALENAEIREVLRKLSRRLMYELAYQLSNWLESNKMFTFEEEGDYVTRLFLIAKVSGMALAEKYLDESIPETFKGEKVYKTLLYNYLRAGNVKKAEQVFAKMRDLGFPLRDIACQKMIYLYKKFDKKKIASVLKLMEENDVKPTRFIYQLLIDMKGKSNDIPGMEELVEAMKSDGLELDNHIHAVLARHYIFAGFDEKAGEILKEMERKDLEENRSACKHLLPIYAALGKADQVERIWKLCESDGRVDDYLAAISAFGKVGSVEKAEEIFEKRIKSEKNFSYKHKLLAKGKDLVKRMESASHPLDRFVWDTLVKLYVDAREVEKADSVLQKAMQQGGGDIHNTEKIFHHLKQQSGHVSKIWAYQSLLQAYTKAKVPAYGFRERMMADNLIPNKFVAGQLAQVDSFKKMATSGLLDRERASL
ncbi:hypothetical protein MKW92_035931 [Papaver armeniacum]|nr:hypothetical protein MKW92_035931 [Papaver armeniacum]